MESAPWGGVPLVRYPNGAVVPYDPANQAATAAHLAITGYGYHGHHYGKSLNVLIFQVQQGFSKFRLCTYVC